MLGGRTTPFRARIRHDLALPPHASTAHFSAPIMFTALTYGGFLKTTLGKQDARENCDRSFRTSSNGRPWHFHHHAVDSKNANVIDGL